jgi:hypothetical protein
MLESRFEKEAKRLEIDGKNQKRTHRSRGKENEDQLRKEQEFADRDENRLIKKNTAHSELIRKTDERKGRVGKKMTANAEANAKLVAVHEEKQDMYKKTMIAEKDRLEKFMIEKAQMSAEKSAHWKQKVDGMKAKNREVALARRDDGQVQLKRIEAKIQKVTDNREREQMNRQMQSEEQHLHIVDVRQKKDRIDRVDGYRRTELKEEIDGNVERIETLLALKDQLLQQRKGRSQKAEATRGSRGLNLRRDCLPGPGQYEVGKSSMQEMPCMKMAQSDTPGYIDLTVKATRDNPPPMSYDADRLPNGSLVSQSGPSMVNFGNNKRTSFLDEAMAAKEFQPAPGEYESRSQLDARGTKMKREAITNEGLDKFSMKRFPVWARKTETPGPAGYSVDEFTRKEVLRRAQKSLPNLTKDMLRPGRVPSQ